MSKNFKSWPKGWPKSLNYPDIPVYGFLEQTAARVPDRIAIHFGGMELTFGELKILADRFASSLDALQVRKGDRVALHLINCTQFPIAYYGAMRIGAVFTPLSPLLSPREVKHQLNDSGAETLITLDLIYPGIKEVLPETPVKRIISTSAADCFNALIQPIKPLGKIETPDTLDFASLLAQYEPFDRETPIDTDKDLCHLAYTGGTTGRSKGVMLTHKNVVVNVLQFSNWFDGGDTVMKDGVLETEYPPGLEVRLPQDKTTALVAAPWFHAMGVVGYLNNMVYGGTTMAVYPRFDPREYIGGAAKYGADLIGGAPQLFIPLINLPDFDQFDLSGVKLAVSGAAPLAQPILDKLLEAFPGVVMEAYGQTECTMGSCANPPFRDAIRAGSVGLPIFDTEMKVIDLVTGEDLPPGAEGEICIRGPQVMQGYWNQPEADAEAFKDGWLLTGDIGKEDEDGYFYITDRKKKDMIIYKGYNVYPRELEEILFEHPAVLQCAVVGKPDLNTGEFPVAFVELKPGAEADEAALMEFVNSQTAPYKKIRELHLIEAIPVSGAGKVLRRKLKETVSAGQS